MDPQDGLSRRLNVTAPIVVVVGHYYPDWTPPPVRGGWVACLCPAHDEDRPSCSVNYDQNLIRCQACGFRGNVVSIVQRQEGVSYAEAVRRTADILATSHLELPREFGRKPGRRAFGSPGADRGQRAVPARVRGRATPWS